jgi:hypothetical protein
METKALVASLEKASLVLISVALVTDLEAGSSAVSDKGTDT